MMAMLIITRLGRSGPASLTGVLLSRLFLGMSRLLLAAIILLAVFDIGLVIFGLVQRQYPLAALGALLLSVLAMLYLSIRSNGDESN